MGIDRFTAGPLILMRKRIVTPALKCGSAGEIFVLSKRTERIFLLRLKCLVALWCLVPTLTQAVQSKMNPINLTNENRSYRLRQGYIGSPYKYLNVIRLFISWNYNHNETTTNSWLICLMCCTWICSHNIYTFHSFTFQITLYFSASTTVTLMHTVLYIKTIYFKYLYFYRTNTI